jgi:hypothetical protein
MFRMMMLALTLTAASEWLMVAWVFHATQGGPMAATTAVLVFVGLFAANAVLLPAARRRIHDTGPSLWFSRSFTLGSVTALMTGLLLASAMLVAFVISLGFGLAGAEREALHNAFSAGAMALGAGAGLWGSTVGNQRVRVDSLNVSLKDMPSDHPGLGIAHVSDLHIGPLLRGTRLTRFIEQINRLEAEIIVITGDIFDFDPRYVEEGCEALGKLRARHGVYAVLGNHDHYTGTDRVVAGLNGVASLRLLRDSWERIETPEGAFAIAGLDDPVDGWMDKHAEHRELERLAAEIPDDLPRLLLVHRPSYFHHAEELGFPLVLAGHTHGGQIALPFAANTNVSRMISERTRGLFAYGESQMYVNRGLGMAGLPLRLNCPREIALIQLSP